MWILFFGGRPKKLGEAAYGFEWQSTDTPSPVVTLIQYSAYLSFLWDP